MPLSSARHCFLLPRPLVTSAAWSRYTNPTFYVSVCTTSSVFTNG
jgi:hypothetical protein